MLEVGSREVTGPAAAAFPDADYTGFDFHPGRNVDVVGDAHRLTSYFPSERKFDLIFSLACFQHFAMPWVVADQMVRLLKTGGTLYVETHFSYLSHERPWNFFQFSDMGLRVLFPPAMGMECIEAGFSNPMVGRFSALADPGLRLKPVPRLYCHSEYLGRKTRDVPGFERSQVSMDDVVGGTVYPKPS